MICSVLIMTIIFINGIENAKQKVKHLDSVWKEEDIDAKTKAWLLMVESGKVDDENLRRITPKSIFIAPLLSSRTTKCQEGYTYDHLGQCVKIIKTDPKTQLELLLKKLNALYGDKTRPEPLPDEEDNKDQKGISEPSTGPLQFSIPILNEEEPEPETETGVNPTQDYPQPDLLDFNDTSDVVPPKNSAFMPVPLPMIMLNRTLSSEVENRTESFEFSGSGPLNDTEPFIASGYNYTDVSSGDYDPEEKIITPDTMFLEDTD